MQIEHLKIVAGFSSGSEVLEVGVFEVGVFELVGEVFKGAEFREGGVVGVSFSIRACIFAVRCLFGLTNLTRGTEAGIDVICVF